MVFSLLLTLLFFLTALIYSMVGLGGGSTYLALLALFSFPYTELPKLALLCNLLVAATGFMIFYRSGHFVPRKSIPFVVTSIPAAYLGGRIPVEKTFFLWMLALSLLAAGLRLFFIKEPFFQERRMLHAESWWIGLPLGALLGLLAGLVGIGGGIFLAPVLYLLGWNNPKQVSATTVFFILVNSLAGLGGQMVKSDWFLDLSAAAPLLIAVFIGGQIGSRLGARKISKVLLRRVTAGLILFVSLRLLWGLL